jgi:cysteine desulfurase
MAMHPGLQEGPIYLDYNATTPVDPLVFTAMSPFLSTYFGNPSSTHYYGRGTREAIEVARGQVALALGCASDEVIFTGSGSESDTLAIRGVALLLRERGNHVTTPLGLNPRGFSGNRNLLKAPSEPVIRDNHARRHFSLKTT